MALHGFRPTELVFIRLTLAGITVGLVNTFQRRKFAVFNLKALTMGLFQFAGTYLLYTWSLKFLPSGVVGTLTLLSPVLTYFVASLAKVEKPSWPVGAAVLLSIFGASLCVPIKGQDFMIIKEGAFGFLLIMLSNLSFAVGNVGVAKLSKSRENLESLTAGGLLWGALFCFVIYLVLPKTPFENLGHLNLWYLPLYLGVVATGLGYMLWNQGIVEISATLASVVGNLKAPLSLFWGALLLSESVSFQVTLGTVFIVAASGLLSFYKTRQPL